MFDVTMGSYDGANIFEPVWFYLLDRLSSVIYKSGVGIYRDDELAAINNANGQKPYRFRKDFIALFKEEGVSITIETNLTETDFLGVTFNLRKTNNTPIHQRLF